MSHSISRRRRWRTFATTLALTLGSLVIPAAALADGEPDWTFNGTGLHVGSDAEGTLFKNQETRLPMLVQTDPQNAGKIVIGGSRTDALLNDWMTLVRYNVDGSIDGTFGINGVVRSRFAGTPANDPGNSGAVAMVSDGAGNIVVAGWGGSQSMFAARWDVNGQAMTGSAVCMAPHLIDYTARALALRADGRVILVGYARDRFTATPTMYGVRANVALTGANRCGAYQSRPNPDPTPPNPPTLSLGSNGVRIDGLTDYIGTPSADPAQAGRWYDGVTMASPTDNRYIVASTISTVDNSAWIQRFTAAGPGALDATFGAAPNRVVLPGINLHAVRMFGNDIYAAGETTGGATAADRHMVVARVNTTGGLVAGYGAGGIAGSIVGGGSDSGQAIAIQTDGRVIVGGGASSSAFGLTRFDTAGQRDATFGNGGEVVNQVAPGNNYITAMALRTVAATTTVPAHTDISLVGRNQVAGDQSHLTAIAGRYYAIGTPPPMPPPPTPPTPPAVTPPVVTTGGATGHSAVTGGSTTTHVTTPVTKAAKRKLQCIVPKVTGKKLNKARVTVYAKGCKVQVKYTASKKAKNTVLAQSRKAGKKLGYRSVVKLTVATKASALKKS